MKKWILLSVLLLVVTGVAQAIPDPSAVYCILQGYEIEIRTDEQGNQYGVCVFPDGSECSTWAYYCKCEPNGIGCWPGDFTCHWPCEAMPCKEAGEPVLVSKCCEGLDEIYPPHIFDANCNKLGLVGWLFLCSDCGNGICECWESKCNCPEDCAQPRIIYVDADANGINDGSSWTDAYNYLQDAFADANSAPKPLEIRVAQGIYKPDQGTGITPGDRMATFQLINGVTLRGGYAGFGEPDPNERDIDAYETILSGDLNGNDIDVKDPADLLDEPTRAENSYHVVTGSGTDPNAILDGFIITGGNANSSWPRDSGAGMYNEYGSPTVINCIFSANSTQFFGGGMYNENSSPILNFCTFSENSTDVGGGGIYNYNSSPTLTNCTFRGNRAKHFAGGMDGVQGSSPVLVKCTFSSNSAGSRGGGISHAECNLVLSNCIFSGNSADNSGGGVYCHNNTNLTLNNCIFAKNKAPIGEAVACDSTREQYQNTLKITNCILWDEGNEIWNNDGSTITISYTDLKGGQAACYDPCDTIEWGMGNIDADPCFADPGFWHPNGTPADANDDFWVDGDYHLKSQAGRWDANEGRWTIDEVTSLCIDAGNPGCPLGDEPNDPNNVRINMGAFGGTAEASKTPADWRSIADLTNDWTVDFNDLKVFVDYWLETGECIPSDLNRNQSVDFSDFAIFGQQWSGTPVIEPGIGKD